VIDDPHEPPPVTPGGLLLMVGAAVDEPAAIRSLRRAAERGFVAALVKARGRPLEPLVGAAESTGVALLAVPDEIPWRHLDALLCSALSSGSGPGDDATESGGEQLFSIANAVAAVVGGSVAIEDLDQHVIAYSSIAGQRIDELRRRGILDRRVPRGPLDDELYRAVMAGDAIVRFPQLGEDLPRAAIALRAGSLPLGTLWAIEAEGGLSPQGEQAILDGARLAALHMLRSRSAPELERLRRGELLRGLLDETGATDRSWARLGFRPGDHVALIGFAPASSESAPDSLLVTQLARELSRICETLRPEAPVSTAARAVYVMVGGPQAAKAAARLAARAVSDASRTLGARVFAAVSTERTGPHAMPGLRDEVDQILRVSSGGLPAPPVATLADVQSSVLLLHLSDEIERRPELRQPALQRLIEQDRRRGTELATSLLAWLESSQNFQAAADRLHVHPNTLRYRLRRIQELAPVDLADPDQRLATWLELRLTARR
jgi:hypothetical protein